MSLTTLATNGQPLALDQLPQSFTYSAGFVTTISVVLNGTTYVQTFTNNGTNITAISAWVPQ